MLALILTAAAVPLASALALRDVSAPYSFPSLKGCPVATEYSCENTTAVKNTCCTSTPGGLVLVTSFW